MSVFCCRIKRMLCTEVTVDDYTGGLTSVSLFSWTSTMLRTDVTYCSYDTVIFASCNLVTNSTRYVVHFVTVLYCSIMLHVCVPTFIWFTAKTLNVYSRMTFPKYIFYRNVRIPKDISQKPLPKGPNWFFTIFFYFFTVFFILLIFFIFS